jgi:FKBP-type peptidyl-prolyl cis-trans isomerase
MEETTFMRRGHDWVLSVWGVVALLGLSFSLGGCQEPTEIVPIGAPGSGYSRIPPPEKEAPQALGEPNTRAPVDPTLKKAVAGTVSLPTAAGETVTTPSGVKYETLKAGDGPQAKPGDTVVVHYTGTLTDGTVFDTSHKKDKDEPVAFKVGGDTAEVIAGWDEAVPGMRVGERRKLTIPPELAYGEQGRPPSIPSKATLVFEIELVDIKPPAATPPTPKKTQ